MRFETRADVAVTCAPEAAKQAEAQSLGSMPEWDLRDLYLGPDDMQLQNDIADASNDAARMKAHYQGQLDELAKDGAKLAVAIKAYEELSDLMGKIASYAGLYYAQKQADPARAKFYGDISP